MAPLIAIDPIELTITNVYPSHEALLEAEPTAHPVDAIEHLYEFKQSELYLLARNLDLGDSDDLNAASRLDLMDLIWQRLHARLSEASKAVRGVSSIRQSVKSPTTVRKPRTGCDAVITLLIKHNPKRGKSADRFALYRDGMTVGEYVAAGGKRDDIPFDTKRNFIKVDP